jgi:outer membrane protein OmpA-like peptidoglycan-associated protein
MAKRALWLAAAVVAAVPLAAQAGDAGWYAGGGGGVNFKRDGEVGQVNNKLDFDTGWMGLLRGGYDYGNGWRTELEGGYRDNNVDKVDGVSQSGDVKTWDAMVNVLYEFETGTMFRPYLGIGLGGANVSYNNVGGIAGSRIDDQDWVFAFQGIAGANIELDPNWAVFADYRYFATDEPDFNTDSGTEVEADERNHSVVVGVRYKWLKPKKAPEAPAPEIKRMAAEEPAPPPPAAKEEIPRNFIIFFDWDKDNITPEAQKILSEAAEYAKQAGVARIVLTGHADRSGSAKYNEGLSMRRAQNAMKSMVELGIPGSEIAVFAKGETQPLVPTEDGVREPQNRRVEIVLE